MSTIVVIPDTQARADVPTDHLHWIGQYIVDQFAGKQDIIIVHLGDHADMPSLSSYDRGKKAMEGRRYLVDIAAANHAFDVLNGPLIAYNKHKAALKEKQWWPERHFLLGNHEDRITRACESDAQLDGLLSLDALNYADHGWIVHPFLDIVNICGIAMSHYFYQPLSGRPFCGTIENRLKSIGVSFTMGHQQQLLYGMRYALDKPQHGLVAGACYPFEEVYKGPQGNSHWRGIIVKYEAHDGTYCPMFVSLEYLALRYAGVTVAEFMAEWNAQNPAA